MFAWGKGSSLRSCDALLERVEKNDPTLVELAFLPLKNFTSDDCLRLASAIRRNGTEGHLRSIHASGHAVSTESLQALGAAVACACSIILLAIGDAQMGDEGIEALCLGLSCPPPSSLPVSPPTLQVLDLSCKGASKGAMKAIGKFLSTDRSSSLTTLDMSRNEGIGEGGGIHALSEAFKACSRSSSENGTNGCCVAFRQLRTLNLAQCKIGSDDTTCLVNLLLANVQATDNKPIDDDDDDDDDDKDDTDDDNASTGTRCQLELVLNSNPIERSGCISIGSLLSRERLSLLSSLSLVECNIGNDGVSALVEAAKAGEGCAGLIKLDLSSNRITPEGAAMLSTALATENGTALMSSLRELRLSNNDIGGEGIASICRTLVQVPQWKSDGGDNRTLSILELCKTNCGADGAVATIKCGAIEKARLFGNRMGSVAFAAIAPLLRGGHPSLVELDIGGNDAKEDAVESLLREIIATDVDNSFVSTLRILEIGGNEVGERVELALKDLKVVRPELDVARDKPTSNGSWSERDENVDMC